MSPPRRRLTTVPVGKPPATAARPLPRKGPRRPGPPKRQVARILDQADASLLDIIDNLLNRGVVLNADLVLGLAGVDLVYVRLAAILCAADRLLPRDGT